MADLRRLEEAFGHADQVVSSHGGAKVGGDPTASLEQLEEVARRTLRELLDSPDFDHQALRGVIGQQARQLIEAYGGHHLLAVMALAIERAIYAGALWERERHHG